MLSEMVNPAAKVVGTYKLGESAKSAAEALNLTKIYKMNSNENPYGVSPIAAQAMRDAAAGVNYYPDPTGVSLRERLAERLGVKPENIVCTEGASVALTLLAEMFLNPGDEVIEHWPTYSGYQRRMMDPRQAVAVRVPMGADAAPDFDAMFAAITPKTRMALVCNPNNPVGTVCDPEKLREFARKLPKNILLVVDEAYIDFADEGTCPTMADMVNELENLVVIRTFSKIAGLAGARIGYAVACPEMIFYYNNMVNFFCASSFALAGAEASLNDPEFREMTVRKNREEREFLIRELKARGYRPYPSQSNFIACEFGIDPEKMTELLRQKGVLIRGNLGVARITLGTHEDNQAFLKAVDQIKEEGGL